MATRAEIVFDLYLRWRQRAASQFTDEQLPTIDQLKEVALNTTLLRKENAAPLVNVWNKPLTMIRALVDTDNAHGFEKLPEALLFTPVLESGVWPDPEVARPRHNPPRTVFQPTQQTSPPAPPQRQVHETIQMRRDSARPLAPTQPPAFAASVPEPPKPSPAAPPEPPVSVSTPQPPKVADVPPSPLPPDQNPEPPAAIVQQDSFRVNEADFRDYVFTDFRRLDGFADPVAVGTVKARQQDGYIYIEWSMPKLSGNEVRLFRVISDEEEFDLDPEIGEQRCVTIGSAWVDTAPLTSAVRMYQVWVHTGPTELLALQSEPVLVGEDYVIEPVDDLELSVAGGEICGQWSPKRGTYRVAVYRATDKDRVTFKPKNEIELSKQNLQGFRFIPEQRGVSYKFIVQRQVRLRNSVVSSRPSQEQSIDVPAEVSQVDIRVVRTDIEGDVRFDISWENPSSGEVRLYRTQNAPEDGLSGKIIDLAHLEDYGLSQRDWANDLERGENHCTVGWPVDWFTIYLTPVSVVGDKCMVGQSHSQVRVGEVTNQFIRERVVNQLVTFGWPRNAHEVTAFLGTGAKREQLAAIDAQTYQAEGGMRLSLRTPGDIYLVPSVHHRGEIIWGEETQLHYAGVTRLAYNIYPHEGRVYLLLYAEYPEQVSRSFTLRFQQHRLPLEAGDGLEVKTRKHSSQNADSVFLPGVHATELYPKKMVEYWEVDPQLFEFGRGGFIRLFSHEQFGSDGRAIALQDPHVGLLMVDELARRAHAHHQQGGS